MSKKADVTQKLASAGTAPMGAICHWSLRSFKVERDEWSAKLAEHGIAEAEVKATPFVILSRTMDGLRGRYAQRRVPGVRGAHALLWVYHDADAGKTKADHAWSVSLDLSGPVPQLAFERKSDSATPDAEADALRARVEADFAEIRDYALTADLSATLSVAMPGTVKNPMWEGVSLRDSGGVFFVAAANVARVEAFRDWVQAVAPETRIDVLRLTAGDGNRETVARSAGSALATEIDQINAEIAKMIEEEKPSAASIARKAKGYGALRARVGLFADVLGDIGTRLVGRLDEVEAKLRADVASLFGAGGEAAPESAPESEPLPEPIAEPAPEPAPEAAPAKKRGRKAA